MNKMDVRNKINSLMASKDFWIMIGLLIFTLANFLTLLPVIADHNYYAGPYIFTWITLWNCHTLETMNFKDYWASNSMYPYSDALTLSDNLIGLAPFACPIWWTSRNSVLTYNIGLIVLLWLTAVSTYFVVKRMIGGHFSAVAGTLLFAFYPWIIRQGMLGRWHMVAFLFIPIIIYANWLFWQQENWKYLVIIVISWFWTFLISMYSGIFLALFLGMWNILWFFHERTLFHWKKIIKWIIASMLVWIAMTPIFLVYYQSAKNFGVVRDLEQQERYSGNVWKWFVTTPENWLWGQKLHLSPLENRTEQEDILFPGLIAIAMFLCSFFIKKMPKWLKSLRWTGLLFALCALGPYAKGLSWRIPLPFLALWHLFPPMKAIRNPNRMAPFVLLVICFLTAFIMERISEKKNKFVVIKIVIILGIALEVFNYSIPRVSMEAKQVAFYKSLVRQGTPRVIIEMPAGIVDEQPNYLIASTYHWNKLINGITGMWPPIQHQLATELFDFPSSRTLQLLQSLDVDTLIIHEDKYKPDVLQKMLERLESSEECKFIKRIDTISLWSIKKGTSRLIFNPDTDFQLLGASRLVEGRVNVGLSIEPARKGIVFNPYAPITFTIPSAKPWAIDICVRQKGKELCKTSLWYSPGLFHARNCIKQIATKMPRDANEIVIKITMVDKRIVFAKKFEVLPAGKSPVSLPPYLKIPSGYQPIPLEQLKIIINTPVSFNALRHKGDELEGDIEITNPGPYYWSTSVPGGVALGARLVCDNGSFLKDFLLSHDLFPGDTLTEHIHVPLPESLTNCRLLLNGFGRMSKKHYQWFPEHNITEIWRAQ